MNNQDRVNRKKHHLLKTEEVSFPSLKILSRSIAISILTVVKMFYHHHYLWHAHKRTKNYSVKPNKIFETINPDSH